MKFAAFTYQGADLVGVVDAAGLNVSPAEGVRDMVELIERFDQADTSREKQAYRLTSEGRRRLVAELARMKQLTRAAASRLTPREA